MHNSLLNKIKGYLVTPWMGILSDNLYQLSFSKQGVIQKPVKHLFKLKYLLISRQYYQEIQKEYPVENKKELIKIIKLEKENDAENIFVYRIGEYKNKKRMVTFAYFNEKAKSYLQKLPWVFCLPESWYLGDTYTEQLLKVESNNLSYWLYASAEKSYSYPIKGIYSNMAAFCAAAGINNSNEAIAVSRKQVESAFFEQNFSYLLSNYQTLIVTHAHKALFNIKQLMPALVVMLLSVFVYNSTVSFYLKHQLISVQEKQQDLIKNSGQLFNLQKDIKNKANKITVLNKALFSPGVSLSVWKQLAPLYQDENLQFIGVTAFANNSVRFMAEAPKATKILELLSKQPQVVNAKFYTDVVQMKKIERFSIAYTISTDAE